MAGFKVGNDINLNAMGMFNKISDAKSKYTIVLNNENGMGVSSGGKLNPLATKLSRSATAIEQNNNVRKQLLENLAKAFGLNADDYAADYDHRTETFSSFKATFLKGLKERLGDALKLDDFGIDLKAGGEVTSGKPLTERRITAIRNKLAELHGDAAASQGSENFWHNVPGDAFVRYFNNGEGRNFINQLKNTLLDLEGLPVAASKNMGKLEENKYDHELASFWLKTNAKVNKCKSFGELLAVQEEAKLELTQLLKSHDVVKPEQKNSVSFEYSAASVDSDEDDDIELDRDTYNQQFYAKQRAEKLASKAAAGEGNAPS